MKDPVCGMEIDEKKAKKEMHEGEAYYFCSDSCKEQFDKNPKKYIKGAKAPKGCC